MIFFFFANAVCTEDGKIQLVGGRNNLEGRVEICFGGIWGTICDDLWDVQEAQVVCRQLGHNAMGAQLFRAATFGAGNGPIYLDNLDCSGSELTLTSCPRPGQVGENDCSHGEDAGVRCGEILEL